MRRFSFRTAVAVAALSLATGCFSLIDSAINHAANRTGEHVGNAIGDQVGSSIERSYSPMFLQMYTTYLFALAFNAGGYSVMEVPYKPGEFTRWNLPSEKNEGKLSWVERAYLFKDGEGNQWWKVKFHDAAADKDTVMEALFSKDQSKLLRLRAQFPNDAAPKELPVEENTYYAAPHHLTKQSLKGAEQGKASVTVPAGTFTARHIVFGDAANGTHEWFLVEKVPGGNVKYVHKSPKASNEEMDRNNFTLDLASYGSGAKSELGTTRGGTAAAK